MLQETPVIVLNTTKYTDSLSIITCFTLEYGRASYFVRVASKKGRGSNRNAFFQPLSMLVLNVNHHQGKSIQQIKDVHIEHPFSNIPFHPIKNVIALFIAELLYRCLSIEEAHSQLYSFLENSILQLDAMEEGIENFHMIFMIKLTRYLGFEMTDNSTVSNYFDLQNGMFVTAPPLHAHYIEAECCAQLSKLIGMNYQSASQLRINRQLRVQLLNALLDYYKLHVADFKGLKSFDVFQILFD
jgi:DNA repair protein RecO (recombination protein O)